MKMKTKVYKWLLIKFKSYCTEKEIINKTKQKKKQTKNLTEWEKIFASQVINKELISKIYKWLKQFNIKKKKIETPTL